MLFLETCQSSEDTEDAESQYVDAVPPTINNVSTEIADLTTQLTAASENIAKLTKENEDLASAKNTATEEARRSQETLTTITEKINALEAEKSEAVKTLKTATDEKDELATKNRGAIRVAGQVKVGSEPGRRNSESS